MEDTSGPSFINLHLLFSKMSHTLKSTTETNKQINSSESDTPLFSKVLSPSIKPHNGRSCVSVAFKYCCQILTHTSRELDMLVWLRALLWPVCLKGSGLFYMASMAPQGWLHRCHFHKLCLGTDKCGPIHVG